MIIEHMRIWTTTFITFITIEVTTSWQLWPNPTITCSLGYPLGGATEHSKLAPLGWRTAFIQEQSLNKIKHCPSTAPTSVSWTVLRTLFITNLTQIVGHLCNAVFHAAFKCFVHILFWFGMTVYMCAFVYLLLSFSGMAQQISMYFCAMTMKFILFHSILQLHILKHAQKRFSFAINSFINSQTTK